MKPIMLTCLLFSLASCCDAKTPGQVTSDLYRKYSGMPANEFFVQYGLPGGEFQSRDGSKIYRWTSLEGGPIRPSLSVSTYSSPAGLYQIADTYTGIRQTHYCELRIYADMQDTIQKFAIAVDSIGEWSASRCSEIFEPQI